MYDNNDRNDNDLRLTWWFCPLNVKQLSFNRRKMLVWHHYSLIFLF